MLGPSTLLWLIGDVGQTILYSMYGIAAVALVIEGSYLVCTRALWPALCRFGNWLGRP